MKPQTITANGQTYHITENDVMVQYDSGNKGPRGRFVSWDQLPQDVRTHIIINRESHPIIPPPQNVATDDYDHYDKENYL